MHTRQRTPITIHLGGKKIRGFDNFTIGDGSCLIHALLQACDDEYSNAMDIASQMKRAREVRDSMIRFANDSLFRGFGRECSPPYLRALFRSSRPLGDEVIAIVPKVFHVNVLIYDTRRQQEYIRTEVPNLPTCIVLFNGGHYSSFSVPTEDSLDSDRLFEGVSPALLKNVVKEKKPDI